MFVWLVHRVSGLFLVALFAIKIVTAFFLYTKGTKPEWALLLHRQPFADLLILVLFSFHALYGLKTVIYDLGLRREKLLFWASTVAATALSLALVTIYLGVS